MNFTDQRFVAFFAVAFIFYYLPPLKKAQLFVVVAASLIFYASDQPYLLLLLIAAASITSTTSYFVIANKRRRTQLAWAWAGVAANLCFLGFFKYKGLLYDAIPGDQADSAINFIIGIPLPIGISFYTFHGISLLVDVYRGGKNTILGNSDNLSFSNHFLKTVLYLTFFPQLIAGPIVKAHVFYPQIRAKSFAEIDWERAIKNLIIGYFLKSVIADNLQEQTYFLAYPYFTAYSTSTLLTLLFGYSMQIFSDFAGYSLIALGLARLFGYDLPENFRFPYISQSFSEFWTRWHISLSSWLRQYLYFPLGGNRTGRLRTFANLMIVMFLGGLWHGAAWSYAVWGAWHGIALAVERMFRGSWFYRSQAPIMQAVRMAVIFSFVTVAWLLFKLPNFDHVLAFLRALFDNSQLPLNVAFGLGVAVYALPVIGLHALHFWERHLPKSRLDIVGYGGLVAAIVLNSGESNAFIYFQF